MNRRSFLRSALGAVALAVAPMYGLKRPEPYGEWRFVSRSVTVDGLRYDFSAWMKAAAQHEDAIVMDLIRNARTYGIA